MTGYRRAAVALHGVAVEDRRWVLNALPATDKAALLPLLDELKELGFSEDGVNVAASASNLSAQLTNADHAAPISLSYRIRHANAEQMFSILENEPSSLIAQLLSLEEWPWSKPFLNLFPVVRQSRILASRSITPAPARVRYLLDVVASRLSDMTQSPGYGAGAVQAYGLPGLRGLIHAAFSFVQRLVAIWKR